LIIVGIVILFFTGILFLFSGTPISDAEKYNQSPPIVYDVSTRRALPTHQQWIIPVNKFINNPINFSPESFDINKILGENSWVSPTVNYQTKTGKLFVYIDYAGKNAYDLKESEFYIQPVCVPVSKYSRCPIESLPLDSRLQANTLYEPEYKDKPSFFYGVRQPIMYEVDSPRALAILFNSSLPEHTQVSWMRISINDKPLTIKKINLFLSSDYQIYFKFLLIFILPLIIYDYRINGGFSSQQSLTIGSLLMIWSGINTIIWDINYIVIGCLLIAFSSVFYMFANHLYKLIYGIGSLIIVIFSYQYFGGMVKYFYKQTLLLGIIGIAIFVKEPE
jgi:hypothetical protein